MIRIHATTVTSGDCRVRGFHAEFKCMAETGTVAHKPAGLTFSEAACLSFGGTTALDFFRMGNLRSGESVLVNGASGAVGSAAVQIAKHIGAQVTAVCSGANAEWVEKLGADSVLDYTREDFTRNGRTYDVIIDTAGTAPYSRCRNSLKEAGRFLVVLAGLPDMLPIPWVAMTTKRKIIAGPATERVFPFARMIEAHRYVDTGRKKGNVIVTLADSIEKTW